MRIAKHLSYCLACGFGGSLLVTLYQDEHYFSVAMLVFMLLQIYRKGF